MSIPIKPEKPILEILLSLESNGAFAKFIEYLKYRASAMGKDFSLVVSDTELRQLQGQAFELNEIIHLFETRHKSFQALTATPDVSKGRTIL